MIVVLPTPPFWFVTAITLQFAIWVFLLCINLAACGEADGYVWRAVLPSIIVRLLIVRPILIFIVIHQVGYIKQERPQKLFDCLRIRFKLDNRCGSFDCDYIIDG